MKTVINNKKRFFRTVLRRMSRTQIIIFFIALLAGLIVASHYNSEYAGDFARTEFSSGKLSEYNGTNPGKPIYLAYQGLVYDVTPGRKYYEPGGSYHFLAGKDATAELLIAGGDIIKRKYKVIGTYSGN